MVKKPDLAPYQILGVSPKASPAEITAAYKVLAQIFHPDRFADSPETVRQEAEVRMKALNEAYSLARKGHLSSSPSSVHRNGGGPSAEDLRRARGGPGAQAWTGVPWHVGVRERAAQAAKANEERLARDRAADQSGTAVGRPKTRRDPSVLTGLGLAMYTGNIHCRSCKSVQWLPAGWSERLDSTVYHCSICNRMLLSR